MNNDLRLHFLVKRVKSQDGNYAPLFLRITLDKKRVEISCKRTVMLSKWNALSQKMTGTGDDARILNNYLKTLERQVFDTYQLMIDKKLPLTADYLKSILINDGDINRSRMLVPIFQEHNERLKSLIGKEFAKGTYVRYETSLNHTIEFMKWKYQISDINIEAINHDFITSYDYYLRSEKKCNNNTTVKYLKNFKKIILICVDNGWLDKDPFLRYKARIKEVIREFLTDDELQTMRSKEFATNRLNYIRDIFVFSCYTGLAYADVKKLRRAEIVTGLDKQQWIFTARQKTDTPTRVPVLPPVKEIIKKYEDFPGCSELLLPVLSNQKMNCYLKEIASICGIKKELTFHIARHTFATTVTMANGVSMESVSKMLGHRNIRTTQTYAKILDQKVSEDMMMLSKKMTS